MRSVNELIDSIMQVYYYLRSWVTLFDELLFHNWGRFVVFIYILKYIYNKLCLTRNKYLVLNSHSLDLLLLFNLRFFSIDTGSWLFLRSDRLQNKCNLDFMHEDQSILRSACNSNLPLLFIAHFEQWLEELLSVFTHSAPQRVAQSVQFNQEFHIDHHFLNTNLVASVGQLNHKPSVSC